MGAKNDIKKGFKFVYNGKHWKVTAVDREGRIFAECLTPGVVPAYQMFREKDGEIVKV
jgi:hypothetical protein